MIVAPHLPIGSPERSALFREMRRTFSEDWKAAEAAAAADRAAMGDLYFIRAGDAVKIGRTSAIAKRLANMQANNHLTLDCALLLKARGGDEGDWHKAFQHLHIRGEWFAWADDLERAVVAARAKQSLEQSHDH